MPFQMTNSPKVLDIVAMSLGLSQTLKKWLMVVLLVSHLNQMGCNSCYKI